MQARKVDAARGPCVNLARHALRPFLNALSKIVSSERVLTQPLIALAAPAVALLSPLRKKAARLLVSLPLLLCLCLHAQARDDYPRQTALDALQYRIRLSIADAGQEISAETEIV